MAKREVTTFAGHPIAAQTHQRIAWVDFAKAAAIILVLLYHIGGSGVNYLFPASDGPASPIWETVNRVLVPMRMPLFFLTAGVLAQNAIMRNWSTIWHSKITVLLWPYLIWSIGFAFLAGYAYSPNKPWVYTADRIIGLAFGFSGYWFLIVLAIFFITAKLFRSWPTTLLILSLILAFAAPFLEAAIPETWSGIYTYAPVKSSRYAFWYFLGCFVAQYASKVSSMSPWTLILGGGAGFTALTFAAWDSAHSATLSVPLSATGLVTAVGVSIWAVRNRKIRALSRYLSGRTLPIYLLHPVLINITVLIPILLSVPMGPNELWATTLTPLLTVAFVSISTFVYDRILPTRFAWIYQPPRPCSPKTPTAS